MKQNFLTYKLSQELTQILTKYEIPINDVYWVLKSLFVEVEKMYLDQVQKEVEELQQEEADKRDAEGEETPIEKVEGEIVNE